MQRDAPTVDDVDRQPGRDYLYTKQLSQRTPWSPKRIRQLMDAGVLVEGVHYFRPLGPGTRAIFSWTAVSAWIEGRDDRSKTITLDDGTTIECHDLQRQARALLG